MGKRCSESRDVDRVCLDPDPGSGIRKRELSDSHWELEAGDRSLSTNKRGRRSPPFSCGCGSLTLLAALLLPALSSFLCHCAQSPLSLWDPNREGPVSVVAAPLPPGTSTCLRRCPSRCTSAVAEDLRAKNWGCQHTTPPVVRRSALALFPALFLSALSSLLRHDSSLEPAAQLI